MPSIRISQQMPEQEQEQQQQQQQQQVQHDELHVDRLDESTYFSFVTTSRPEPVIIPVVHISAATSASIFCEMLSEVQLDGNGVEVEKSSNAQFISSQVICGR